MTSKQIFQEYEKFMKDNPQIVKIIRQLNIDEESYLKALISMNNNVVKPRKTLSNNTYSY